MLESRRIVHSRGWGWGNSGCTLHSRRWWRGRGSGGRHLGLRGRGHSSGSRRRRRPADWTVFCLSPDHVLQTVCVRKTDNWGLTLNRGLGRSRCRGEGDWLRLMVHISRDKLFVYTCIILLLYSMDFLCRIVFTPLATPPLVSLLSGWMKRTLELDQPRSPQSESLPSFSCLSATDTAAAPTGHRSSSCLCKT